MEKTKIEQLFIDQGRLVEVERTLDEALRLTGKISASRELSLVRTKIEEARMWAEKCYAEVSIELARRTCI